MARVLIIHQNFPGQYKHLAPALVRAGHTVRATVLRQPSEAQPAVPSHWQGVALWPYSIERGPTRGQHPWLGDLEAKVVRGQACFRAMQDMRAEGFQPDVVLAHLGWGEALFVKDVWPNTKLAVYGEFYYQAQGGDVGFDPEFQAMSDEALCKLRLRNANQLLHLQAADAVIAPTHWQASTFPAEYRPRMTVIHDGIDTQALTADPSAVLDLGEGVQLKAGDEVVTFVSRNLEPYRGYHSFMRALPELLRQRPKTRVLLIGGDQVSYGAAAPQGKSWKQIFIDEVRTHISDDDWGQVHFLGRLPYAQYLTAMRVSAVHVYLTYPFVLSWSLLEAMSLGCAIVGSDTAPLREVITHDQNGRLVDFFDPLALAHAVAELLGDPQERQRLGQAAREFVCQHYDLERVCLPQQMAVVNTNQRLEEVAA
jgi:glycosyltransferase involved in cell wall biosynthesis